MAALTTYARNKMLDLTLQATAYTSPANVYLSAMTVAGNAAGGGTEVGTRQAVTFAAAASGAIATNTTVTWSPLDAAAAHTVVGWTVWDASTTGNMLAFHTLASSVTVNAGRPCSFASGNVTVTSDGVAMKDYLANKWLDHLLRHVAYTAPAAPYLGLYRVTPTRSAAGTEETDSAYSRLSCPFNAAASGSTSTTNLESWAPLLADADETETGWAISDAATVGNQLFFGAWSPSQALVAGDTVKLDAGTLTLAVA